MTATPEDYFVGTATKVIANLANQAGYGVGFDRGGRLKHPYRAVQRDGVLFLQRIEEETETSESGNIHRVQRWRDVEDVPAVTCGKAYRRILDETDANDLASAVRYAMDHPEVFEIHLPLGETGKR